MKVMESNPVACRLQIRNGAIHFTPLSTDRDAFSVPADTVFHLSLSHHRDESRSYSEGRLDGIHAALNNGAIRDLQETRRNDWVEIHLHAGEYRDLKPTIYQS